MKIYLFCIIALTNILRLQSQEFVINIPYKLPTQELNLTDHFSSVRYLPLETKDEYLIGGGYKVRQVDSYLWITTPKDQSFLFDSKTGAFVRKIGHWGNDPGGYQMASHSFYNPYNKQFYFKGWNYDIIKYDINGVFLGRIQIPLYAEQTSPTLVASIIALNATTLCAYFSNLTGMEERKLILFNEEGILVKQFKNSNIVENARLTIETGDGCLYRYDDKVFFKERYVDTVYMVTEKDLIPKFVLDFNKRQTPYLKRYETSHTTFMFNEIKENYKYIIFDYSALANGFIGFYNKKTKETSTYRYKFKGIDDINDFLPIEFHSISQDGTLIGSLDAFDVSMEMEEKQHKKNAALNPLLNVSPEDNPIVVFME